MNLLVVIGGRGDETGHLCTLARSAGMGIVWVGETSRAPAHAHRVIADETTQAGVSPSFSPKLTHLPNIVGVVGLDRTRWEDAARLSTTLGLPDTQWGGHVVASRVDLLGELAAAGVRVPSFRRVTHGREIPSWPGARLVKPDLPGQLGTYRIGRRWSGEDVLTMAGRQTMYAQRWVVGSPMLVQAALRAGKVVAAVAARRVLERLEDTDPAVVVDGHDIEPSTGLLWPSALVEQVARALGWRAGPVWVDCVLTDSGPVVLDADRGLVGDGLLEAMDVATAGRLGERILGSFAYQRVILSAESCAVVRAVSQRYVCAIGSDAGKTVRRYIARMPSERIADPVSGKTRLSPERVVLHTEKGAVVPALRTTRDRLGYVIASDREIEAARDRAERYAADLYASVCLDPDDGDEDDWP